jgi:hypothetical protein
MTVTATIRISINSWPMAAELPELFGKSTRKRIRRTKNRRIAALFELVEKAYSDIFFNYLPRS